MRLHASGMEPFGRTAGAGLVFVLCMPVAARAQDTLTKRHENLDVQTSTVSLADVPDAFETVLPDITHVDLETTAPPSLRQIEELETRVGRHVVRVVAVKNPTPPFESPLVVEGTAVWIGTPGKEVHLTTALHWLADADEIYIIPETKRSAIRTLAEVTLGWDRVNELHEGGLARRATLHHPDPHRNLTTLKSVTVRPNGADGLMPVDPRRQSIAHALGLHSGSGRLIFASIFASSGPDDPPFYLQTNFGVTLGTPIVNQFGKIIGLTAMPHPTRTDRVLLIPPGAISTYLQRVSTGAKAPKADLKNGTE
jgi:hypothetical protein